MAFFLGLSTLLGFVSVLLMTVAMHHWRRRVYAVASVVMPLLAATLIAVIWYVEAPNLLPWGLPFIAGHALAQVTGGVAGVAFGRITARGLVRAFVPPSWRGPLAYLWLVDGKAPFRRGSGGATMTPQVNAVRQTSADGPGWLANSLIVRQ